MGASCRAGFQVEQAISGDHQKAQARHDIGKRCALLIHHRTMDQGQQCAASTSLSFTDAGLTGCQATITCNKVAVSAAGATQTAYDFSSEGRCGDPETNSGSNPDFAVSRTLVAEAFDGALP